MQNGSALDDNRCGEGMEQPKRRLSAVWFADLVGYSALSTRDEPAALRLVETLQALAREVVASYEGRIVKFIGDAVLAEFSSTDSAVRAAVTLHERFTTAPASAAVDAKLRIGVHLGEVNATPDGDLYGDGINTAARLQREAAPGQVIVSEDVWRQLRQRPEFRFSALGAVELRGITTRVEIYDVLFGTRAALAAPSPSTVAAAASPRRPLVWVAAVAALLMAAALAIPRFMSRTPSPATVPAAPPPAVADAPPSPPAAAPQPAAPKTEPPATATTATKEAVPRGGRKPPMGRPIIEVRRLVDQLADALMSGDPARVAALGPGAVPMSRTAGQQLRQAFGEDLALRPGRVDVVAAREDAIDVRFNLLAKSRTRPETPVPFNATVGRVGATLQFVSLQRAGPGRGRARGETMVH